MNTPRILAFLKGKTALLVTDMEKVVSEANLVEI